LERLTRESASSFLVIGFESTLNQSWYFNPDNQEAEANEAGYRNFLKIFYTARGDSPALAASSGAQLVSAKPLTR
jgi:hypothetical protein